MVVSYLFTFRRSRIASPGESSADWGVEMECFGRYKLFLFQILSQVDVSSCFVGCNNI